MTLTLVALLVSLVLTLLSGVVYIDFLRKKMFNQQILADAPERHQQKAGTPTTGGVFLILSAVAASIIALFLNQTTTERAFVILLAFIFFGLAGFLDDFQKISKKQNKGITPRMKLGFQIAIALLPTIFLIFNDYAEVDIFGKVINIGFLYPFFAVFIIVGVSNAVNLTDGLDGLAAGNSVFAFLACSIISILTDNIDLAIISAAVAGSCLGFLYFNKYPAKVFMGDTGSLALGGLLAIIALAGRFEIYLILIGLIFMSETLSVMMQVTSFKLTGKRIFKMSPIHHHFELCGWSEVKIVTVFSIITLITSAIAIKLYMMAH